MNGQEPRGWLRYLGDPLVGILILAPAAALMVWGPEPVNALAAVLGTPLATLVYFSLHGGGGWRWGLLWGGLLAAWNAIANYLLPFQLGTAMLYVGVALFAFIIFGGPWRVWDRLFGGRVEPPTSN